MRKLAGGFIFLMSIGAGGKLETNPPGQPENPPLKTRYQPFALYVTQMHRQFHDSWMGFIAHNGKPAWAKLAIAVAADGKVARVNLLRSSGDPALDQAALGVVKSAAPFPKPPSVILSADGLFHVDWEFHADEPMGCSTIGVTPHRFDSAGHELPLMTPSPGPLVAPSPVPAIR
jgi:TonB family protein